eukprot:11613351-Ditylum_brightwellii.AAC.1
MNIDTEDGDDDGSDSISHSSASSDKEEFSITEDPGMNLFETSSAGDDNDESILDSVSLSENESDSNLEHCVKLEHGSVHQIYVVYCNAMILMNM